MSQEPAWQFEYSVESDASPAFAWSYWTNIDNWDDPPARFSLRGAFAAGSQGTTFIPGREPIHWTIAEVEPGKSAKIWIQLEGAIMSFEWRFEGIADGRTRITQHIELTGENAAAYLEAGAAFRANLPDGMKKIAAAMARAEAVSRNA